MPSVLVVGTVQFKVTVPLCLTVIEKVGREAVKAPSVAVMLIFAKVPTFELLGVPESCPVAMLKVAHAGLFWILKPTVPPLLFTVGWNE